MHISPNDIQEIVKKYPLGSKTIAANILSKCKVKKFLVGDKLLVQGDESSSCAYFILQGSTECLINERCVGIRSKGELVGEMRAIEPLEPRSASIVATEPTHALEILRDDLFKIFDQSPEMWRTIAEKAFERLRNRSKYVRMPNSLSQVFVASSAEAIGIMRLVQNAFKHDTNIMQLNSWTSGTFNPGGQNLTDIRNKIVDSDFAIVLCTPDDATASRGSVENSPRDNVLFELGIALGQLDPCRVFLVKQNSVDIKMPSDLEGFIPVEYKPTSSQPEQGHIDIACNEIRDRVRDLGPR